MNHIYTCSGPIADVMKEVSDEISLALSHHPHYPEAGNPVRRVAIMAEEVGEAMAEALDMTRGKVTDEQFKEYENRLYYEVVQVAASAIHMLVEMRKERAQ